ncbi:hypothetical protein PQE70_gp063 [Bacillus phage vB_BanS_Nate]|uniref:Uncharacterized protein n=1 Tax=Bacillus phage vB_BanS_Nate TaxID=2894788 RepID=A0AAE8YUS2_9CAUD|nr:hypothetical protein PQE70_gp063 [Bacillus phage vB_BanS_Nate]UGO50916.1 hypothetical protein NATE_63 [Bacillus phage vB_BanS_Nate]
MSIFNGYLGKTVLVFESTHNDVWIDSIVTIKEIKTVGRKEFFGRMQPVKRPLVEYANGQRALLNHIEDIYDEEDLKEDLLVRGDDLYRFIEFEKVKISYDLHDTYEFLYVFQNTKTYEIVKLQPDYSMNKLCESFMDFFKIRERMCGYE